MRALPPELLVLSRDFVGTVAPLQVSTTVHILHAAQSHSSVSLCMCATVCLFGVVACYERTFVRVGVGEKYTISLVQRFRCSRARMASPPPPPPSAKSWQCSHGVFNGNVRRQPLCPSWLRTLVPLVRAPPPPLTSSMRCMHVLCW